MIRRGGRFVARAVRFVINRTLFAVVNRCTLYVHSVAYDEMPRINGVIRISNQGSLSIGRRVHINSGQHYNPIGGDAICSIVVQPGARVRIADGCGISNSTLHSFVEIDVGENVNIGGGCRIYDSDFHPLDPCQRMGPDPLAATLTGPVRIESGTWIGGHSMILKGVTIGRNAVIGAGSVVTKSVPAGEIWAGNPARFIRKLDQASLRES